MMSPKTIFFKKSKYSRKVISFVLGSIGIIFLLFVVMSSIAFAITYSAYRETNIESALSKLEMLSIAGTSTFNEAQAISSNIALEGFVDDYKYVEDPLAPNKIMDTYELIHSLSGYTNTFRYADECVVYFKRSESIVFDNYFRYMEDYYGSFYSTVYESYEAYRDFIFDNKGGSYVIRPELSNLGPELNTYVALEGANRKAYAVVKVKVNTEDLYEQMYTTLAEEEVQVNHVGIVAITDSSGQLLMHVGEESLVPYINNEQYDEFSVEGTKYVSVSVEDSNGFRYTYMLPNSVFTRQLTYMTYVFLVIFLCVALGITGIGFILMKRHAQSLNHIMNVVEGSSKSGSLYQKIDTKIQDLIEDNALLTNNLIEEKGLLLDMFYEKLLKGSFVDEEDLQHNMAVTGTNINGKLYSVGLLCADMDSADSAIDSIAAKNISIKFAANDIIISELYAHVVLCNQMVTVIFVANTDEESFHRNIELFAEKFRQNMQSYNYDYYICMGGVFQEVSLVRKAYNLAHLMALKHKNDNESGKMYKASSEDIPTDDIVEINDTLKNRLYSLVTKGDQDGVEALLDHMIKGIIKQAKSKSSVKVSVYILWELLAKMIKDNYVDEESDCYAYYNHYMNLEIYTYTEQMRLVSEGFTALVAYFDRINVTRSNAQMISILDFINTEFTNPDLSLIYIADRFGISVTKLSKLFKENNIEYSFYISNLRMNLAKHTLVNTDSSIKNIARQTGYTSSNSFCRAFKRLQGISPNEYRQNNK